ncbi:MAG: hypothetical protein V4469_01205 [Patescibacteria group bacterium]
MKRLFNIGDLLRYGTVAGISYIILYGGTYLLVNYTKLTPSLSYMIVLSILYIGVYISYTKFVFKTKFTKKNISRFVVVLIVIWIVNNSAFFILNDILKVHYLITITINIILFGGLKFLTHKHYVFKE